MSLAAKNAKRDLAIDAISVEIFFQAAKIALCSIARIGNDLINGSRALNFKIF